MLTPEQDAWLRAHVWALLATTSADGTPQVTMVAYAWDGTDVVVSCRGASAKARNAARRPRGAVTVPDGRLYLTVAGPLEVLRADPEREALTRRVQEALGPEDAAVLQADLDRGLDAADRVVVRLRPERAVGRLPRPG